MKNDDPGKNQTDLRARAEARYGGHRENLETAEREQLQELVHELRVQKIELEMQIEDLRKARDKSEKAHEGGAELNAIDRSEKKIEQSWRENESRFRFLFENAPQPYQSLDENGHFLDVNRVWLETMGYQKPEVLGQWFGNFLEPGSVERFQKHYAMLKKDQLLEEAEFTLLKKEDEKVIVLFNASVQSDPAGGFLCSHCILTDVTERRSLETQLFQAQKMQAVGTLAGGVAHNFNNVLMGIQGRANLLMMNNDRSAADLNHLKGIEEDVQRATELTKDLLGFARGGKHQVKLTDLNVLLSHENEMFSHTKKEFTVRSHLRKGLWPVSVDQNQMRQIFINLYLNACQAMPEGGDIFVETQNCTVSKKHRLPFKIVPGRYVKMTVTDTGVGMDESTREKIFEPFFTTKEIGKGTGLGLASVYGIVKNHGGFVTVSSQVGEGTSFHIHLPASKKGPAEAEARPERQAVRYGQGTVLLVTDEEELLTINQELVQSLGYESIGARSGQEALEIYGQHPTAIDLVILDMIMPEMGGGETYDRLKEMDPEVRVLLASGYNVTGQVQAVLDRGCSGFIQKPFDREELSRKIQEVIGSRRSKQK